ncbi:hypothetical protein IMZ48_49965, partial [Candidatus Bathyarchaeota archaeon]|nr:hypothetical protein [Candidatus Bathyarchaeota archaeon]
MKAALIQIRLEPPDGERLVASFFIDARGSELARSPLGLYRSLVYQLVKDNVHLREILFRLHQRKLLHLRERLLRVSLQQFILSADDQQHGEPWQEEELRYFLQLVYGDGSAPHTVIFIDALDECGDSHARSLAFEFRKLTMSASEAGVALDVCLSSRLFPSITVGRCLELFMEHSNSPDIAAYVDERFSLSGIPKEDGWLQLRDKIVAKSSGLFLWVELTVDLLLRDRDQGRNLVYIQNHLRKVPEALEGLFVEILRGRGEDEGRTLRLFQWIAVSMKPLRLREWHHILAFIHSKPPPRSLREWKRSANFTEDDEQLTKQMVDISMGLVGPISIPGATRPQDGVSSFPSVLQQLQQDGVSNFPSGLPSSVGASPGSLDHEQGETRLVRPIHDSVREFFLERDGFSHLYRGASVGKAHLAVAHTCLD